MAADHAGTSNFELAEEAAFTAGGHRFAVFAHDWRVETFDAWWEREAERSQARDPEPELTIRANAAPIVVLSESEFAQAVRQALRDYTRPASLSASLLLRSRVAMDVAGLQTLLREAVERLKASDRTKNSIERS